MSMQIIPAIDIKNSRCVRLRQGEMSEETVFSNDIIEVASQWVEQGAKRLHIVDLDGAVQGRHIHSHLIAQICKNYPDLIVQVGGGIRDMDTVKLYLDMGVQYVIIGTKAVNEPEFIETITQHYPQQIIVGLDAKASQVATDGWTTLSKNTLIETARRFEQMKVAAIIYTDISRDGMLKGVNIESTRRLSQATSLPIIASGGVSNENDIKALLSMPPPGVEGVIVGRAIYEGTLDFKKAMKLVENNNVTG